MCVLSAKNICKDFYGVNVLENVNFELKSGEIHGFVGENGAGKSTLIKIISGVYKKTSGKIEINGEEVLFQNPNEALEAGIAVIHQELSLIPQLSIGENIFLNQEPMKGIIIDWKKIKTKSRKALEFVGAHLNVELPSSSLSVAEKQMVMIARALVQKSKILIMDEPSSSLTKKEVNYLFKSLRDLKETGLSIIYISHKLSEIFEIADRITIIRNGKNVDCLNINETNPQAISNLMLGKTIGEQYPKREPCHGKKDEILKLEKVSDGKVVKDISFKLNKGEILGITGLLGSGKTEVAKIIYGILPLTSGKIYYKGENVKINTPDQAINFGIAYLPENRREEGLISQMSVRENATLSSLKLILKYFGKINQKREKEIVMENIKKFNIKTKSIEQKVHDLSGGNQQKVVLSRCVNIKPGILILDEPTKGIDVGAKFEIYRLIKNLANEGSAIIFISMDVKEVIGVCDRVCILKEGFSIDDFSMEEKLKEDILSFITSKMDWGGNVL